MTKNLIDRIGGLVLADTGLEFDGADFRQMCSYGVYLFLKDALPLYVGMSDSVLSRASSKRHLQARQARAECDTVKMWACLSEEAALELEELLISALRPRDNKYGQYRRRRATKLLGISPNTDMRSLRRRCMSIVSKANDTV